MAKKNLEEFRQNAVRFSEENKELGFDECAKKLGIGSSTLRKWRQLYLSTDSEKIKDVEDNILSERDEIKNLKKELTDTNVELNNMKADINILKQIVLMLA
jgi:transposase-like protein